MSQRGRPSKPKQKQVQPEPSVQQKLAQSLQKRDQWRKVAADQNQTPASAAAAAGLARSWDAAALAYQKALLPADPQSQDPFLDRLLGLDPLEGLYRSQSQPSGSPETPETSTGPETSTSTGSPPPTT